MKDMREPRIADRVRLTHDLPELALSRGTVGVVCSTCAPPPGAYEVEFESTGLTQQPRALLLANQVEVDVDDLHSAPACPAAQSRRLKPDPPDPTESPPPP